MVLFIQNIYCGGIKMSAIDEKAIREHLSAKIPAFIIKSSVASTNTYLKKLAQDKADEFTVVIAEEQTNGRGRTGNSFFSPAGGLYFSILIKERLKEERIAFITALSAVAAALAIEKLTNQKADIKWINDIYINKRKVCGILAEGCMYADNETADIILGIGVNICLNANDIPADLQKKAGALYCRKEAVPPNFKNILCAEILNYLCDILTCEEKDSYIKKYKEKCSVLYGKKITYKKNNTEYSGTVFGIDERLHLIVSDDNGANQHLSSGEIKITGWE